MKKWTITTLPIESELETKKVLKRLPKAHAALAELKGIAQTIPNQSILINTLGLQEAKDSSEIENIITTHDDLYKSELNLISSLESKEVKNYIEALKHGFELINKNNILSNSSIVKIQSKIEKNNAGFRKVPGTVLKNAKSGEIVYEPPQDYKVIQTLMKTLEKFINDDQLSDLDPIIKMAVIHLQFESIHPFYDGNGRTGRIINILYLINQDLLQLPILYLSNYIIKNKVKYYELLQSVRSENNWEEWLLYVIDSVEKTSLNTIQLIKKIKELMQSTKIELRENYKFYSQDLLNNLYKHPYSKIEYVVNDLKVSRITAANYLNQLAKDGILRKEKLGKSNYYVNEPLFELLTKR
ncbi:Fic family protein [Saprospiraceae bacterium]|nr:Fic family protein [Saprospiraceae bacterium]